MKQKELKKLEDHYLKMIKGEKTMKNGFSRIFELLKKGSCTVCTLPHHRFAVLSCVANNLRKIGWVEVTGKQQNYVNYKMTDKLKNIIEE